MPMRVGVRCRREPGNAACELMFPAPQPGTGCAQHPGYFVRTNPPGIRFEGEAVGIGIGIESGHGVLLGMRSVGAAEEP